MTLEASAVEALFTKPDGSYEFARWGRPIAPVAFGIDDDSLTALKDGIAQTVAITGGTLAETDPELGANFMWFFCSSWDELLAVPNLEKLLPNLEALVGKLTASRANQYRSFSFENDGAIQLCVVLLRMDTQMADLPIQTLATGQTLRSLLLWSETAFKDSSPIGVLDNGICIVKPEYAALVRAAYHEMMPPSTEDPVHALRLSARAGQLLKDD